MKKVLNKEVNNKLANAIIVTCTGLVIILGFFYYQQSQKINELELKLESNYHLQERVIATMKKENMLEEVLSLEGFSEEERETIRSFAENIEDEKDKEGEEDDESSNTEEDN